MPLALILSRGGRGDPVRDDEALGSGTTLQDESCRFADEPRAAGVIPSSFGLQYDGLVTRVRAGAVVLFVNRRGEVLLRLRGNQPGLPFPDQWDTIGGAIEAGETHAEAVVRETAEEVGLELSGQVYWREFQAVVLLHIYAAPLDVAAEEMVLTEGQRIAWVSLNEALELPLVAWVREVLPEFVASSVYRAMLDMQSRDS